MASIKSVISVRKRVILQETVNNHPYHLKARKEVCNATHVENQDILNVIAKRDYAEILGTTEEQIMLS
jgi:hypothetical protein